MDKDVIRRINLIILSTIFHNMKHNKTWDSEEPSPYCKGRPLTNKGIECALLPIHANTYSKFVTGKRPRDPLPENVASVLKEMNFHGNYFFINRDSIQRLELKSDHKDVNSRVFTEQEWQVFIDEKDVDRKKKDDFQKDISNQINNQLKTLFKQGEIEDYLAYPEGSAIRQIARYCYTGPVEPSKVSLMKRTAEEIGYKFRSKYFEIKHLQEINKHDTTVIPKCVAELKATVRYLESFLCLYGGKK